LHFEVRDSKTEHPLNPLRFGFNVKDTVKPVIYDITLYDLGNKFYQNGYNCGIYKVSDNKKLNGKVNGYFLDKDTLLVPPEVGIALNTTDFVNNSKSVCGVYGINLKLDGKKIYQLRFDEFSFYETRYINSLMDYPQYVLNKERKYRLFKQPGNRLSFLRKEGDGIIRLNDTIPHTVEIDVFDIYENFAVLTFVIRRSNSIKCNGEQKGGVKVNWKKNENILKGKNFEFDIQGKSLYDDAYLFYSEDTVSGFLSPVIKFGENSTVPLHRRNVLE